MFVVILWSAYCSAFATCAVNMTRIMMMMMMMMMMMKMMMRMNATL